MFASTFRLATSRRAILAAAGLGAAALAGRPALAQGAGSVIPGKDGWLYAAWEDIRRVDLQRVRRVVQLVNNTVITLNRAGVEVVILLTPTRARIYPENLPAEFQPSAEANRRYELLLAELQRPGTLVPDLATLFAELRRNRPADPVYFKADIHWTPMTADATAIEVAKQIKARYPLPPSSRPGVRLGAPVGMKYERNDLAQLLPPSQRASFAFQPFRVRLPQAPPRGQPAALLDDDQPDVVVVGNSFMQADYSFPTVLSNQLERPVGLSWKPARNGPYRVLLDYLGGEGFKQRKPKLLVWHHLEGNMEFLPDSGPTWGPAAMPVSEFQSELRRLVEGG